MEDDRNRAVNWKIHWEHVYTNAPVQHGLHPCDSFGPESGNNGRVRIYASDSPREPKWLTSPDLQPRAEHAQCLDEICDLCCLVLFQLDVVNASSSGSMSFYITSGEWDLVGFPLRTHAPNYGSDAVFPDVTFYVIVNR